MNRTIDVCIMNKVQNAIVFIFFILILFNINTVMVVRTNQAGALSTFLIIYGIISLIITKPLAAKIYRIDLIKSFLLFMGIYIFFGSLMYCFYPYEGGLAYGLYILGRSLVILFSIGGLFFVRVWRKGLNNFLKELFLLLFIACLSVPVFKLINVSLEENIFSYDYYTRYSGIWANANVAASFVNSTVIICFYLKLKNCIKPLYFYFSYMVMAYSIFLTSSNTGLIIFLSSSLLFLYYLSASGRNFFLKRTFVILSLPVLYFSIIWFLEYIVQTQAGATVAKSTNMLRILVMDFDDVYFSDRDVIFFEGMAFIKENWVAGYGIGYFTRPLFVGNTNVMHNYFLSIWGEAGITGLAALLIFLGFVLYKAFQTQFNHLRFLYIATFTFFVLSFASGGGIIGNYNILIYYLIVAIISNFENHHIYSPPCLHEE